MQQRQPMNAAQRRILLLSLLAILLVAALFFLFYRPGGPSAPQATPTPEATFATVIDALETLPTPTPAPSPVPTPTPVPTPAPTPSPLPLPENIESLKKGSKGEDVVRLQLKLIELGYLSAGSNDGDFGSATETAVKAFQASNSLKVDGIAGKETQTRMYSPEAVGKP